MELKFEKIDKSYGKNHALKEFSATLTPGIYALMGPNGSGKSTLMNILTDNLKADSGEITYAEVGKEHENVLKMGVRFREKIGFMPQYPGMYPNFTVESFMWYMASLKDVGSQYKGKQKKEYIAKEIENILKAVELDDVPRRRIGALSGGMKQRLALAQAVLGDPEILILDEPTAGLDPKQRIAIRNYIATIALNKIVLIATHVVSDVEYIAKEVIFLKKGEITDFAPAHELAEKIDGKVWELTCGGAEVAAFSQKYRVVNISQSGADVTLRVLSDTRPEGNSAPAAPTLEDYYLWMFGEMAGN